MVGIDKKSYKAKDSGTLECDHHGNLTTLLIRPLFGRPILVFLYNLSPDGHSKVHLGCHILAYATPNHHRITYYALMSAMGEYATGN